MDGWQEGILFFYKKNEKISSLELLTYSFEVCNANRQQSSWLDD
jgi:hypothetical protein